MPHALMMEPQRLVRDAANVFQPDPRVLKGCTKCAPRSDSTVKAGEIGWYVPEGHGN